MYRQSNDVLNPTAFIPFQSKGKVGLFPIPVWNRGEINDDGITSSKPKLEPKIPPTVDNASNISVSNRSISA